MILCNIFFLSLLPCSCGLFRQVCECLNSCTNFYTFFHRLRKMTMQVSPFIVGQQSIYENYVEKCLRKREVWGFTALSNVRELRGKGEQLCAPICWRTCPITLDAEERWWSKPSWLAGLRIHTAAAIPFIFLFWELRGLSPNFHSHVSVSDLYSPMISLHISSSRIGRPIVGIYKLLTDGECGNWDWDPDIPFLGIFVSKLWYFVFAVHQPAR